MLLAAAANASLPCTRERFAAREATAGWPAGCLSIVSGVGRRRGRREQSRFSLSSTPGWRAAGSGASCSPAGCLVWDQRRPSLGEPAWRQLQLGRRAADAGANCSSAGGRLMRAADATGCLLP